ncbi:MAG TPA: DNA translocase FtsK [Solirubrobacteraceae bacterium]|jgi:S-DNA-T family DNA segregation ATPase FtsK/SpoIIIE|nr:DNA translocase FtsK [Solirubrobacteraceae bacterium]
MATRSKSRKPAPRKRAPAKRRPRPAAARRRAAPRRRGWLALEQRELDVIGLGLVALGVFLALVLYRGIDGGRAGEGMARALAWLLGAIRYGAPVALIGAGALLVLRPALPSLRPFRAGGICLFGALTLALAAGTLGLGPSTGATPDFHSAYMEPRGGIVGEGLYWAATGVAGQIGAHVLAVFLFLAGVPLLTGASIAGVIRATGRGMADTTRTLARSTGELAARRAAPPVPKDGRPRVRPPEPASDELVVHATHAEAPSLDGRQRFPDLFGAEAGPAEGEVPRAPFPEVDVEEVQAPGVARAQASPEDHEPAAVEVGEEDVTPMGRLRGSVTDDPGFVWSLPDPALLRRSSAEQSRPDTAGQERVAHALVEALGHFGVQATVVGTVAGPHITRYELRLAPGTKVAKVAQLKDDLAYALAATDIRILAPIPGKQAVGVEVPNERRRIVQLGDVYQNPPPGWSPMTVWLGKDVSGKAIAADLAKMPHLLVAGTTGAGKSAAINSMLSSILLRATPQELRVVLVDPKQVELTHYESIPHLLTPVITSPRMAANALANLVKEMEERYGTMSLARTRSLEGLNEVRERRGEPSLPYILCVIDELADLMMVAPADVEDSIIRLAQKARAVGIHLVLATQSPRVDVITGMIKANVPSRIAFAVSSQTDSRVILDQNGAESLLGQGDMLFSPVGTSRLQRIQGAYIDEPQIEALTEFWRRQGEPEFREELLEEVPIEAGTGGEEAEEFDPDEDPLLTDAVVLVAEMGTASTSMLQRRLRLGYTRAGRMIDMLERRGIISGYEGSKPRQVLIAEADLPRVLAALKERPPSVAASAGSVVADPAEAVIVADEPH